MEEKKEPGIWVDNTARLACDAAAREVGAGRVNRDSRSTTFGVKPANDSSEVAMTTPSFVSILQAGGTSRAKQQPVNSIGDSSLSGRCPHTLGQFPRWREETRETGIPGTGLLPEAGRVETKVAVVELWLPGAGWFRLGPLVPRGPAQPALGRGSWLSRPASVSESVVSKPW